MNWFILCLYLILILMINGLLFVAMLMGSTWVKSKLHRMDEVKWDHYFHRLQAKGLGLRIVILMSVSLACTACLATWVFQTLGYANPGIWTTLVITIIIGYYKIIWKQKKQVIKAEVASYFATKL
ncbi:MAG: hypothetical protein ACRCZJ_00980 [Erysipelotrichaceae bacterium]